MWETKAIVDTRKKNSSFVYTRLANNLISQFGFTNLGGALLENKELFQYISIGSMS